MAAADVLTHLRDLGFARDSSSDTESYFSLARGQTIIFLKRLNAFGKIAPIYVEEAYEDADLRQPAWELVSCEY